MNISLGFLQLWPMALPLSLIAAEYFNSFSFPGSVKKRICTNKVTVRSNNGVKVGALSFREYISYERLQLCTGRNSVKQ